MARHDLPTGWHLPGGLSSFWRDGGAGAAGAGGLPAVRFLRALAAGEDGVMVFDGPDGRPAYALAEPGDIRRLPPLPLAELARVMPCFAAWTRIRTDRGPCTAGSLRPGDRIQTRDGGACTLLWSGCSRLPASATALVAELRPVEIAAAAPGLLSGPGARDPLTVSGNHLVLMAGPGGTEEMVPARDLLGRPGVTRRAAGAVDYVHLLLDDHHVIDACGHWAESLGPDPLAIACLAAPSEAQGAAQAQLRNARPVRAGMAETL